MPRPHRRIRTDPVPGADPTPQAPTGRGDEPDLAREDQLGAWGDDEGLEVLPDAGAAGNDRRLNEDRPPHYA